MHSPTVDPPETDPGDWEGEAKVAGIAREAGDGGPGGHTFHIDLTEVVVTRVSGDELAIESWHPGRGIEVRARR